MEKNPSEITSKSKTTSKVVSDSISSNRLEAWIYFCENADKISKVISVKSIFIGIVMIMMVYKDHYMGSAIIGTGSYLWEYLSKFRSP